MKYLKPFEFKILVYVAHILNRGTSQEESDFLDRMLRNPMYKNFKLFEILPNENHNIHVALALYELEKRGLLKTSIQGISHFGRRGELPKVVELISGESMTSPGKKLTTEANDLLAKPLNQRREYAKVIVGKTGDEMVDLVENLLKVELINGQPKQEKIPLSDFDSYMEFLGVTSRPRYINRHQTIFSQIINHTVLYITASKEIVDSFLNNYLENFKNDKLSEGDEKEQIYLPFSSQWLCLLIFLQERVALGERHISFKSLEELSQNVESLRVNELFYIAKLEKVLEECDSKTKESADLWIYSINKSLVESEISKNKHLVDKIQKNIFKHAEHSFNQTNLPVKKTIKQSWSNIEMMFTGQNKVEILIDGEVRRKGGSELFKLKDTAKPWGLLKQLAIQGGNYGDTDLYINREKLRSALGIRTINSLEKCKGKLERQVAGFFEDEFGYDFTKSKSINYVPGKDAYLPAFSLKPVVELRSADIYIKEKEEYDDNAHRGYLDMDTDYL